MAALTTGRLTQQKADGIHDKLIPVKVKNGYTLFIGGIVVVDLTGYGRPANGTTGMRAIGVCQGNALGVQAPTDRVAQASGGATGTVIANVAVGEFLLNIDSSDPVTDADIMKYVYLVDDQTISRTSGGGAQSLAGRLTGLETMFPTGTGAWVQIGVGVPTGVQ